MRLENRNAIITGAGSGIGRAIAIGLAKEGASIVAADINLPSANITANTIQQLGRNALAIEVDVSRREEVEAMVQTAIRTFGQIHILVSAAGISTERHFLDLPEDEWDRVIDVNLKGLYLCGQIVGVHMAQMGSGSIINVTSELSFVAERNYPHYIASKGGGNLLTKAMALDLVNNNIRVNALAPGLTRTNLSALDTEAGQAYYREVKAHIPMGRPAEPEEMVGAAVFLASEEASYVTGTTLVVDGGYLAI